MARWGKPDNEPWSQAIGAFILLIAIAVTFTLIAIGYSQ